MSRLVSIRSRLLVDLSILVIVMGLAILVTTVVAGRRAVRALAATIITRTEDVVVGKLESFFAPPASELSVLRGQLDGGVLALSVGAAVEVQRDALNRYLVPVIASTPQISSMMVADDRGREHMLLRLDDVWRNRTVRLDEWGSETRWLEWSGGGDPASSRKELEYDPRARPWYVGAAAARTAGDPGAVHWTEPYTFFTTKQPGITASVAFDMGDGLTHVLAVDILLQDITRFTREMEIGERGRVAVLTADGRLLGLPRDPRFDDAETRSAAYLRQPEELGLTLVTDATEAFAGVAGDDTTTARFRSDGEAWWGRLTPFELAPDRLLWVAVVVPESELLGSVRTQRLAIIGIVGLVLLVGLLRAAFLARRFSVPVERLAEQSARISAGDFTPPQPVASNVKEIRHLADAQDEMREAVQSRMKLQKIERDLDLAREIQRGLMPTEPPSLPGFQIAGWNQAADQTGGDYFDWLQLPSGNTVMTLADVTGHGIGPALIVAVCRAYVRAVATSESIGVAEATGWVNDLLYDDTPPERFVTAAVAVLDPEKARMSLISAGHGPNLFFEAATGEVHSWHGDIPPLGVVGGLQSEMPEPRTIDFKPGDVLVLTTDGFFEWMNPEHEQFGTVRLETFVREHHALEPEAFIVALYEAVLDFAKGTEQADDLTALIVKKT